MSNTVKNIAQNSPSNKPEEKKLPDEKSAPTPGADKKNADSDKNKAK
jgi:hypothetical protein